MSNEDLELLITLDDPGDGQEEDTFNHLQVRNLEYWLVQPPIKQDLEVCTVTHWKNGKIVKQKVFYDLDGMQRQIGIM
jgi:hypothetical protein